MTRLRPGSTGAAGWRLPSMATSVIDFLPWRRQTRSTSDPATVSHGLVDGSTAYPALPVQAPTGYENDARSQDRRLM